MTSNAPSHSQAIDFTMLRKAALILFATTATLACLLFVIVTIDQASYRHQIEEFLTNVDASDGIDEREANGIAWAYFLGFVGACGGPGKATLVNGEWVIPVNLGYGGRPMASPIRINAKTGAVSQTDGPSFIGYRSFRTIALWGIPIRKLIYHLEN